MRTWQGSRVSLYRVSSKTIQPLVLTLARCLQEKGSIQSVQTFGRKVPAAVLRTTGSAGASYVTDSSDPCLSGCDRRLQWLLLTFGVERVWSS